MAEIYTNIYVCKIFVKQASTCASGDTVPPQNRKTR